MKNCIIALSAVVALAGSAQADFGSLFISEVVDGDLAGGNPKFVEICNPTSSAVTLGADDFLRIYFNGGVAATTNVPLAGITIPAGSAYTIASSANDGIAQFNLAYGFGANLFTGSFFGNGDDAYSLETGSIVHDVYGVIGVDGTGQSWEYLDSYANRPALTAPNGGVFDPATWAFGGVAALDGADDATRIALLQSRTSPGVHPIPTPGAVALMGFAGLAAARRRRA